MLLEPCRSILCKFPFRNQIRSYVIVFIRAFFIKRVDRAFTGLGGKFLQEQQQKISLFRSES